jgi:hypothetical protein
MRFARAMDGSPKSLSGSRLISAQRLAPSECENAAFAPKPISKNCSGHRNRAANEIERRIRNSLSRPASGNRSRRSIGTRLAPCSLTNVPLGFRLLRVLVRERQSSSRRVACDDGDTRRDKSPGGARKGWERVSFDFVGQARWSERQAKLIRPLSPFSSETALRGQASIPVDAALMGSKQRGSPHA